MTVRRVEANPAADPPANEKKKRKGKKLPPLGFAPRLSAPQAEVLLLDYSGRACVHRDSNPNLNLGRVKYYPCTMNAKFRNLVRASIAQLAEHALSKRKVASSILAGG